MNHAHTHTFIRHTGWAGRHTTDIATDTRCSRVFTHSAGSQSIDHSHVLVTSAAILALIPPLITPCAASLTGSATPQKKKRADLLRNTPIRQTHAQPVEEMRGKAFHIHPRLWQASARARVSARNP